MQNFNQDRRMSLEGFARFMLGIKPSTKLYRDYRPEVTVIIPAFNEEDTIAATIQSVKQQTYRVNAIIVVDDCSLDNTSEIAKRAGVTVFKTEKNTGFKSKAVNAAMDSIQTPVFLVIDADTILAPDAIEKLIPSLGDGKTLSVCGIVMPQNVSTIWERARLLEYLYGFALFKPTQNHLGSPLVSSGCFSAFNTRLFKEIGGLPENNIAEDMFITWAGEIKGYKVKYESSALCYAKDPENWRQFKGQVLRWYRGQFQCIKDIGRGLFKKPVLAFFVIVYMILSLASPILMGLFIYTTYSLIFQGFYLLTLTVFLVIFAEIGIGFAAIMIKAYQVGKLRQAFINYPFLWIVSPVNTALYFWAFYKEIISGQSLKHWDKGH